MRSTAGGRAARRSRRGIVVAVVALALALSAAGAWSVVRRGPDVEPEAPTPTRPANPAAAMAQRVYDDFSGTARQRDSWYVVREYVANHRMDDCMARAGHPEWDWSRARLHAGPEDALAGSVWFSAPHRRFVSEPLMVHKRALDAEAAMNADHRPRGWQQAVSSCAGSGGSSAVGPDGTRLTTTRPEAAWRLADRWHEALVRADRDARDPAAYYRCLAAAHLPVLATTGLPATELGQAVSTLTPSRDDIPVSATDPAAHSDGWQGLLRHEQGIVTADWACRKDVYRRHVSDLTRVVIRFRAEHATEMAVARRQWRDLAREARALGYHGQSGPLGK